MRARPSELEAIFRSLRGLLARYRPPLVAKANDARRYELWSSKEVVIAGRRHKEILFASAVIQKGYVGFYFMPVYANPEMEKVLAPELLGLRKGKSCFHVKSLDARMTAHIRRALEAGFRRYKKNGWV